MGAGNGQHGGGVEIRGIEGFTTKGAKDSKGRLAGAGKARGLNLRPEQNVRRRRGSSALQLEG